MKFAIFLMEVFEFLTEHVESSWMISPRFMYSKLMEARQQLLSLLKHNLVEAQARMKKNSDLKRIDKDFAVGDWVYLRLQPYRQSSLALRRAIKSSPRSYGVVAYKLELPKSRKYTQYSMYLILRSVWVLYTNLNNTFLR
ncbi:uncharacterized protein LOC113331192 [Papaver somniferum]|uniref:uncharacterized protein LOC113331192 n=1 Tax=Papaver somniferum TaxID=3469 RepID=UPI000E6F5776|nr:uncharacterized protein LOC113331192 [Papaver somniferum]